MNKEEAVRLLKIRKTIDIKTLLKKLLQLGPKYVIVTNGPNGAYATNGEDFMYIPILKSKLIERTGAGDSFASGVIAAQNYGISMKDALKWGVVNSASVVEHVGPQAGLLTLSQMKQRIKKYPNIRLKII